MCRKIVARKIWIFLMNKFKMASSTGSDDDDSVKGKISEWQESSQVLQFLTLIVYFSLDWTFLVFSIRDRK